MDYRNFGRTGVKVSPLCLGCMMFGGRTNEADSCAIIDRALDAGGGARYIPRPLRPAGHGPIAQLAEQETLNLWVVGSSPSRLTMK